MNKFKRIITSVLIVLLSFGLFANAGFASTTAKKVTIYVSAAASTQNALDDIYKLYKKSKPNVTIVFNYGGSGTLKTQIKSGAPCDLFISADTTNMNDLQKASLIDTSSKKTLLRNKLVLISPKNSTKVKSFKDLTKSNVTDIALGTPSSVPAGSYAKETLTKLGYWDKVSPKAVYGSSVTQVLSYVETGNSDAGIVYYTDAISSSKVKIVATAAENTHSPIYYPMAVIKGSSHSSTAKDFENYLLTKNARNIFVKDGFTFVGK